MTAAGSPTITKPQKLAFAAAWLGWAFDGLDGFIYTLIALPFVGKLMGQGATPAEIGSKAALIQSMFLVGWALGGAVFGRIGDKLGRTKTLNLTILTYAIFTGMAFFATEWWHLMIFRFLAALGIGGEWAAGAALVSETLPNRYRHWGSAILQSGYMTGMLMAAFTVNSLKSVDHRYVFLVGVLPALITLWIRKSVPEPEDWSHAQQKKEMPKISALFGPEVRGVTMKVLALSSICLCGAWTILYFAQQLIRKHPEAASLSKADLDALVASTVTLYTLINIGGNFAMAAITKWSGYRKGFLIFLSTAALIFIFGFSQPHNLAISRWWICLAAFTGLGVFAAFPLYFPPLFPTLLRTTGSGFCYNFGRLIAAVGTLYAGTIAPQQAFYYAGFLYIPAVALAFFMPELPTEDDKEAAFT